MPEAFGIKYIKKPEFYLQKASTKLIGVTLIHLPSIIARFSIILSYIMQIRKCKIVVRYTYRNHRDELKDYQEEFFSFQDFRNYWRWQPERAKGINGEQVENSRTLNARLSLCFRDNEHTDEVSFNNIAEFTQYLRKHSSISKAIQYV